MCRPTFMRASSSCAVYASGERGTTSSPSSNDLERNRASFSKRASLTLVFFLSFLSPWPFASCVGFSFSLGRVMTCRCRNFGNLFTVIVSLSPPSPSPRNALTASVREFFQGHALVRFFLYSLGFGCLFHRLSFVCTHIHCIR